MVGGSGPCRGSPTSLRIRRACGLLLAEQAQAGLGQSEPANEVRNLLSARFPRCAPVWVRREAAAVRDAMGDAWAPEVHALRAARFQACGLTETGDLGRDVVDRALLAVASGREAGAVRLLTDAVTATEGLHEAAWLPARLGLRSGRPLRALGRSSPRGTPLTPRRATRPPAEARGPRACLR